MNKNTEIPRLTRLTAILILLQSKRLISATEIAEKFDISKRTAYRDIKSLEQAGVPIYVEEGKGYSLLDGYMLPPIMFSEEEANALITAEKLISRNKDQSLIENHNNALAKVKAVLKYRNKDKADLLSDRVFFMKNLPSEITSDYLSTIQIALTNFQVLKLKYNSISKKELTNREVEPLALYHTKENWILIAWCRLRKDNREFRLDKIESLHISSEKFEGKEFDLKKYFKVI